jgi:hypothetical protein
MEAQSHYENLDRAHNHVCPRCEGFGKTAPVEGRTLPCQRCFGTGEDLNGTLASWEADLQDLRSEWKYYNGLMAASRGGKRLGLSKKVDALVKRGQGVKEAIESLRAEILAHQTQAPF